MGEEKLKNAWFYLHCVVAIIILISNHNGTLEDSLNKFEEKIGIYTVPDTTKIDTFKIEVEDESGTRLERNE